MYLEIDEGFPGHRKTLRFAALMQSALAPWYLMRLWTWATRSAPDGDLTGMEPSEIEMAVQYSPLDGRCYESMVKAGFIDDDGDKRCIHGWMERTGKAIEKMRARAESQREHRKHVARECGGADYCEYCRKDVDKRQVEAIRHTRSSRDDTVLARIPSRDVTVQSSETTPCTPQICQDQTSQDRTRQETEAECSETAWPSSPPPVPLELFTQPATIDPPLLTFECDGEVKNWVLTTSQVDEWAQAYPSLDVLAECRKALVWVRASPARRKTANGMTRYLVGWLSRAQNSGRGSATVPALRPSGFESEDARLRRINSENIGAFMKAAEKARGNDGNS